MKKVTSEYLACDIKEHNFLKCWYIFEKLRLKRMRSSMSCVNKTKKTVEDNEELKKQVQEIWEKMNLKALIK